MSASFLPRFEVNVQTGSNVGLSYTLGASLGLPGQAEREVSVQLDVQAIDAIQAFGQISVDYSQKLGEQFRGKCTFSQSFYDSATAALDWSHFCWKERSVSFGLSEENSKTGSNLTSFVWTHILPTYQVAAPSSQGMYATRH